MSFQPFIVEQRAKTETGVTVGLRKLTPKSDITLVLNIRPWQMETPVQWKPGDLLSVLIGDGPDHGAIRLKVDADGSATVRERIGGAGVHRRAYLTVSLGRVGRFVARPEPVQWCQNEIVEDGWLEIILPQWADETKSKNAQATAASQNAERVRIVAQSLK